MQDQRRRNAALSELPIAQLTSLLANIHRDAKKQPEPFTAKDFLVFAERSEAKTVVSAEVAAVALELQAERAAPPLLIAMWDRILAATQQDAKAPKVRALRSDDEAVWVLAPVWEGRNIRGGLVLVRGRVEGTMSLRDIDRRLNIYKVEVPLRSAVGWIEARSLLMAAET